VGSTERLRLRRDARADRVVPIVCGRTTPEMNADEANPYTTYRHEGLPPRSHLESRREVASGGARPGRIALPYFVARGEGHHTFSETYAQHNEAIHKQRGSQP